MDWLFGGEQAESAAEDESEEARALREEAEELQLKLDALAMAEYRQAQRIACGKERPRAESDNFLDEDSNVSTACSSTAPAPPLGMAPAQYYLGEDAGSPCPQSNELHDMYDFSLFKRRDSEADDDDDERAELRLQQLRLVEAKLREREEILEGQLALQDRKMTAASKALERTRGNLRQMTQQLEGRQKSENGVNAQADVLQVLLAEKERRLMTAIVEASSALDNEDLPQEDSQQPGSQETENGALQLQQLAATTEELTDALEIAQDSEEDARRQLNSLALRMQRERELRLAYEQELVASKQAEDVEIAALQAHLTKQEQRLAYARAHAKQIEFQCGDVIKPGKSAYPIMEV